MEHAIQFDGLTKYYGRTRGIEGLTLGIEPGATYGFLGPNGAGKTTTIRCLLGMLRPSAGTASALGERVTLRSASIRRRIGYVPGEVHLYDRETGRWHLDYVSGFRGGRGPSEADLLERLDLDPGRKVKEYSKGNKQKLALVLALMHDPELLILDEPTSGLDPLNQQVVFELLAERSEAGATVFLSSHILSEVERVCDRVAIVREGHLVAEETIADLLHKRVRLLEVSFAEPVPADFLAGVPGVSDVQHANRVTLRATLHGKEMDPLLKRLAERTVTDLEVSHADLEQVFLEYYRGEGEGGVR